LHIDNEDNVNSNEEYKHSKYTKNTVTDQKETFNSSLLLLNNKENNLNQINKNLPDNIFITYVKDNNDNKNLPYSIHNNNSNKLQLNNLMNNSVLNNSIPHQNLNTLINESSNNIYVNRDKLVNYPLSPKMGSMNSLFSVQKPNAKPLSPPNIQYNFPKNLNSNFLNSNNQNIDYQNSSFSFNVSNFINKSIRNFNSNNNLMNRHKNSSLRVDGNLFPTRIFSANNLNKNNLDRNNLKTYKTHNSDINNTTNNRRKKSEVFNKAKTKISNRERESMFKIKKLNEEISKIAPIRENIEEKVGNLENFDRVNMKKLRSEFRSAKFLKDNNYEKITSCFKKESLDKMNAFYADKFNLNPNMNYNNFNIKLNLNNPNIDEPNKEEFLTENAYNQNFKSEEKIQLNKEQNPISIILFII